QGDYLDVLSLIEAHYEALRNFSDFTPQFFRALANVEGAEAAIHVLMPSFLTDGRQAVRLRRAALSVLAKQESRFVRARKPYSLVIAESTAVKHGKAARIRDLALLHVLLGDVDSAR